MEFHPEFSPFLLDLDGKVRLVEVKWAETISSGRLLQPLLKVAGELGGRAAREHWLVCRTAHEHTHPTHPEVRLVNGYEFKGWLQS